MSKKKNILTSGQGAGDVVLDGSTIKGLEVKCWDLGSGFRNFWSELHLSERWKRKQFYQNIKNGKRSVDEGTPQTCNRTASKQYTPAGGGEERQLTYCHENFIHVHRSLCWCLHEQQTVVLCIGLCFLIWTEVRKWVGGKHWQGLRPRRKIVPDYNVFHTIETIQGFSGLRLPYSEFSLTHTAPLSSHPSADVWLRFPWAPVLPSCSSKLLG